MKLNDLKLLYVCNDFPYPPMHGGLVDMWQRIRAFHALGIHVDVIATVKQEPPHAHLKAVADNVRSLRTIVRKPLKSALLHWKPSQVVIRSGLKTINVHEEYDLLVMQSEFVTEILRNPTVRWKRAVIRVDNDEYTYHTQTAKAEASPMRALYFLQEALRIKRHSSHALNAADMLWFVSREDLRRFEKTLNSKSNRNTALFVPTAIDLRLLGRPALLNNEVLFCGSLWNSLNRAAVEWYVEHVHPKLADVSGYRLLVAGSSRGKSCAWINDLAAHASNIEVILDADDLSSLYTRSSVFVNPMQFGAGVKLKTVEAALRGLPIVSTLVGAEGSGFVPGEHFLLATSGEEFASAVRKLLSDKASARSMVERCQDYLTLHYDQARILRNAMAA